MKANLPLMFSLLTIAENGLFFNLIPLDNLITIFYHYFLYFIFLLYFKKPFKQEQGICWRKQNEFSYFLTPKGNVVHFSFATEPTSRLQASMPGA